MVVVGGPGPARPLDDDELLAWRRRQGATGRQPNRGGVSPDAQRSEPPARQVVRRLDLRSPGRELCEQGSEALELVRRSFGGYSQTQVHELSLRQKSGPCRLTDLVDGRDPAVVPDDLPGAARRTGDPMGSLDCFETFPDDHRVSAGAAAGGERGGGGD